jgi:hypothetical protein
MTKLIEKLKKAGFTEFQDWEIYDEDLYISPEVHEWIHENSPDDLFFVSVWS